MKQTKALIMHRESSFNMTRGGGGGLVGLARPKPTISKKRRPCKECDYITQIYDCMVIFCKKIRLYAKNPFE